MADWTVKEQELYDKNSGLTLRFGAHQDDSNTVFLQVSHGPTGNGTTIVFQRGGEVMSMQAFAAQAGVGQEALPLSEPDKRGAEDDDAPVYEGVGAPVPADEMPVPASANKVA